MLEQVLVSAVAGFISGITVLGFGSAIKCWMNRIVSEEKWIMRYFLEGQSVQYLLLHKHEKLESENFPERHELLGACCAPDLVECNDVTGGRVIVASSRVWKWCSKLVDRGYIEGEHVLSYFENERAVWEGTVKFRPTERGRKFIRDGHTMLSGFSNSGSLRIAVASRASSA